MNQEEYIKYLGEDDWCYCSTNDKKHLRKTHGQSENHYTSYCQVEGCGCSSWNVKGSPIKKQVKNAIPFWIGFGLLILVITFIVIPAIDFAREPVREIAKDFNENLFINKLKVMDCHDLRDWLLDSKGTWKIYQTEGKDIFELRCGWLSMERDG